MLRSLVLLTRLLLPFAAFSGTLALPSLSSSGVASAQDDDWGSDDEYGDDEDTDGGFEDFEEEEDEEEQPPVTSGGLFTKKTFPVAELERPLTLTGGIFEAQLGFDIDMSDQNAFETWRAVVVGRYGIRDHIQLQFGADFVVGGEIDADFPGQNQARLQANIEPAIVYDLVDFRLGVEVPINPDLPDDEYGFDIVLGFPFRYKPKEQFGIIALDKLMTIHTIGGGKPDLTVGVGLIFQVVEQFAVLARGEVTVPEFNTNTVIIPATAAAQFSPNNRFDIGLEFTFANLNEEETVGMEEERTPFDRRFLLLYAQARF